MKKFKKNFKEIVSYIIGALLIILLFSFKLPYYVLAPGGTIALEDRISVENSQDINGTINMLYVTQYQASIPFYLLSYIIPNWDLEKMEDQQLSDENMKDIEKRNKIMLDNSLQNAILVAYSNANKDIKINERHSLVLATIEDYDTPLKVGDEIVSVEGQKIDDFDTLKAIIESHQENDILKFKIKRNNQNKTLDVKVGKDKKVGVVIVTNYDYQLDPEIEVEFKNSESGSSGGLMLSLSIYQLLTTEDIIKGRKVAGTGTIDAEGNVGEIDGIKYKIMGAYHNKMDIVFVPKKNYQEAVKVNEENNYHLKIVKVEKFSDAVNYLKNN